MDLAGHDLWTKKLGEAPWHAELREETRIPRPQVPGSAQAGSGDGKRP